MSLPFTFTHKTVRNSYIYTTILTNSTQNTIVGILFLKLTSHTHFTFKNIVNKTIGDQKRRQISVKHAW